MSAASPRKNGSKVFPIKAKSKSPREQFNTAKYVACCFEIKPEATGRLQVLVYEASDSFSWIELKEAAPQARKKTPEKESKNSRLK
ncbi:hypothetical protein LA52FAK_25040 [Desulforhopalus sp. 52FAK]